MYNDYEIEFYHTCSGRFTRDKIPETTKQVAIITAKSEDEARIACAALKFTGTISIITVKMLVKG